MTKDEITRPEPGSLPARISFIEQADGSAGYYIRFKDVPEEAPSGGEPERKYIPVLQYETQEKALQAAIDYRNRRARELGLPVQAHQGRHTEETREEMSNHHNRLGLRGLELSLDDRAGTVYPQPTAMWTEEDGQRQVRRGVASRGIWKAVEELTSYLKEHIHINSSEDELARRGAKGAAQRLVKVANDPERKDRVRQRIKTLFRR